MPQINALKCPSCGASVTYDGGSEATVSCVFCNATVIIPQELRLYDAPQEAAFTPATLYFPGSTGEIAVKMPLNQLGELKRLAQAGQKIEAIKLYRQIFNVGLAEAKDAVEKIEAGEPLVLSSAPVIGQGAGYLNNNQPAMLLAIDAMLKSGKKIEAIKLYRQLYNVGLAEAKAAVEMMQAGQPGSVSQFNTGQSYSTPQFNASPYTPDVKVNSGMFSGANGARIAVFLLPVVITLCVGAIILVAMYGAFSSFGF